MADERMHTPYSIPLDPLLAISLRNHAYFSHLAPLILFFFTKRRSQKGGPWHNNPAPKYAPVVDRWPATPTRARIAPHCFL